MTISEIIDKNTIIFKKTWNNCINEEFDFLEISLIAQDEDGSNEICNLLKTINVVKEN